MTTGAFGRNELLGPVRRAATRFYRVVGIKPLVLQAGMGRAGSTLLYRLLDEMLKGQNQVRLRKRHKFRAWDAERAMLVFTVCRDIRDIIASELRQETKRRELGYPSRDEFLDVDYLSRRHAEFYRAWQPYSSYEFVYERYRENPDTVVAEIMQVVGCFWSLSQDSPEGIRAAAESSDTKEMAATLHRTNAGRSSNYADVLSDEQIRMIERDWWEWLQDKGYVE